MIEASPQRAPAAVIVLGSLWLSAVVVSLAVAVGLIVLFGVVRHFAPGGTNPLPPAPPVAKPLYWAFQHYVLTGSLQGALALVGIYSGVQFLRIKPWARTVLEAAGWTSIALSLFLGIWSSQFWFVPGPHAATSFDSGAARPVTLSAIRLIGGLVSAGYYAVLPAAFIWLLRSRAVRPVFEPGGRPSLI